MTTYEIASRGIGREWTKQDFALPACPPENTFQDQRLGKVASLIRKLIQENIDYRYDDYRFAVYVKTESRIRPPYSWDQPFVFTGAASKPF